VLEPQEQKLIVQQHVERQHVVLALQDALLQLKKKMQNQALPKVGLLILVNKWQDKWSQLV
jgi:hypothetical protein